MERIARAALAATLSILLVAGGSLALTQASDDDLATLQAAPWTLSELDGQSVSASAGMTAEFGADGSLGGFGGCNTYAGSYETDGAIITVGPIASTRVACEQTVMDDENLFLDLLQNAGTWSLDGADLLITASDGGVLVFAGEGGVEPTPFAGTLWTLNGLNGSAVPADIVVTATFAEDFTVSGSGGCNTFSGGYSVDGDSIDIGPLASTRKLCEQDVMDIEFAFLDGMEAADTMAIDGTVLLLTSSDGGVLLEFVTSGGEPPSSGTPFAGTEWYLVDLDGDPAVIADGATIIFAEDGTISGFGGCNQLFGSYTTDGSSLTIDGIAATRVFCEGIVDREAVLLDILYRAVEYSIDEDELTITADDGAEVIFATEPGLITPVETPTPLQTTAPTETIAPSGDGLVGPTWVLSSLQGQALPGGIVTVTIAFAADGTVSGNGGCNDFAGTFTADGSSISLTDITPGTEPCDAMTGGVEQAILQLFPFVDTYSIVGGELNLDSSFGLQSVWTAQ